MIAVVYNQGEEPRIVNCGCCATSNLPSLSKWFKDNNCDFSVGPKYKDDKVQVAYDIGKLLPAHIKTPILKDFGIPTKLSEGQ